MTGFAFRRCSSPHLFPTDPLTLGESRGLGGGGRRRQGSSWTYLKVEAVKSWAELLSAGHTVLLTAAGCAGEQAEQQEVTEQDLHGAGAGSRMLKHK